jgi:hypothetical protein
VPAVCHAVDAVPAARLIIACQLRVGRQRQGG